jgi:hypothetical protein
MHAGQNLIERLVKTWTNWTIVHACICNKHLDVHAGSGKTHTLIGDISSGQEKGLLARAVNEIAVGVAECSDDCYFQVSLNAKRASCLPCPYHPGSNSTRYRLLCIAIRTLFYSSCNKMHIRGLHLLKSTQGLPISAHVLKSSACDACR